MDMYTFRNFIGCSNFPQHMRIKKNLLSSWDRILNLSNLNRYRKHEVVSKILQILLCIKLPLHVAQFNYTKELVDNELNIWTVRDMVVDENYYFGFTGQLVL
uniref:Uncharacterized protein n=1 Tax=Glossina palpalis gambiensis TaxID=67801 RepID=A0A1B0B0G0_9MUSC